MDEVTILEHVKDKYPTILNQGLRNDVTDEKVIKEYCVVRFGFYGHLECLHDKNLTDCKSVCQHCWNRTVAEGRVKNFVTNDK